MAGKDLKSNKSTGVGFLHGAGRAKGSTNKIQLRDCMDEEEIAEVIDLYVGNQSTEGGDRPHPEERKVFVY